MALEKTFGNCGFLFALPTLTPVSMATQPLPWSPSIEHTLYSHTTLEYLKLTQWLSKQSRLWLSLVIVLFIPSAHIS